MIWSWKSFSYIEPQTTIIIIIEINQINVVLFCQASRYFFQFYDVMISLCERTFISRTSQIKLYLNHNNGCPTLIFFSLWLYHTPSLYRSSTRRQFSFDTKIETDFKYLYLSIFFCLFMFRYSVDKYCLFILQLICFPYVYLFILESLS